MSERAQIALQVAIVVLVLAAAAYGIVASATAPPAPIAVASVGPDASLIAQTLRSPTLAPSPSAAARPAATPTPTPTPAPTFVTLPPSPSPTVAPKPPDLVAYRHTDPRCFCVGIVTSGGWTVVAPFDATLEIHVYQLVGGQLREGTDVPGVPLYPYVTLIASDGRRLTYRPGALDSDTKLVAQRSPVRSGDDLFRIVGSGPSSWRDFYDRAVGAQVIVSMAAANGADLDPTSLMRFR